MVLICTGHMMLWLFKVCKANHSVSPDDSELFVVTPTRLWSKVDSYSVNSHSCPRESLSALALSCSAPLVAGRARATARDHITDCCAHEGPQQLSMTWQVCVPEQSVRGDSHWQGRPACWHWHQGLQVESFPWPARQTPRLSSKQVPLVHCHGHVTSMHPPLLWLCIASVPLST